MTDKEDETKSDCSSIGPSTMVDLGFIENEPENDAFDPQNFPSKVGGKPVWLDPRCVLGSDDLKCQECSNSMVLLTQLYCPLPGREKDAYHRTLYLFICPKSECCKKCSAGNFAVSIVFS